MISSDSTLPANPCHRVLQNICSNTHEEKAQRGTVCAGAVRRALLMLYGSAAAYTLLMIARRLARLG